MRKCKPNKELVAIAEQLAAELPSWRLRATRWTCSGMPTLTRCYVLHSPVSSMSARLRPLVTANLPV